MSVFKSNIKKKKKTKKQFALYLSTELHSEVRRTAQKHNSTMTSIIIQAIEYALKEKDNEERGNA